MRPSLLFILLALITPAAHAWNKPGHMVIGAIAYQVLQKEDPESLPRIMAVLKAHPSYTSHWGKKIADLPEEEKDAAIFMLAGRWADDIRNIKEFDRPTWHYINIPYKPVGEPETLETAPALPVNILTAIRAKAGRPTHLRLAEELMAAFQRQGEAMSKREQTIKMAEANKAFSHFAW